mgnify:CR=1 FL=1
MTTHYFELSANTVISDTNPIVNNPESDPSSNAVITRAFSVSSPQTYIQLPGGLSYTISSTGSTYTCIGVTNAPITIPSAWADSSWNFIVEANARVTTVGDGTNPGVLGGQLTYSLSQPTISSTATLEVSSGTLSDVSGVMVDINTLTLITTASSTAIGARVPMVASVNSSFSPSKPRSVPMEAGLPYYIGVWAHQPTATYFGPGKSATEAFIKTTAYLES